MLVCGYLGLFWLNVKLKLLNCIGCLLANAELDIAGNFVSVLDLDSLDYALRLF